MYSKTHQNLKLLLTFIFSFVSINVSAVVLYAGSIGDPYGQLGMAQLMYEYGELRTPFGLSLGLWYVYWLIKQKGLSFLTVLIARMFVTDIYWVHAFITPALWSIFVPLTAFTLTRMISRKERISVLAAFLTSFFLPFLVWGSASTPNGAGYIFLFVSLVFSIRYMRSAEKGIIKLLMALLLTTASGFVHPFTGVLSFSFLFLAVSLKIYNFRKSVNPRHAYVLLFLSLMISLAVVQAVFSLQNALYLYFASPSVRERYAQTDVISFSLQRLLETDLWELIFGEFIEFSFKELLLKATVPILGVLGLVYALKKKNSFKRDCTLFMALAFTVCVIDYSIMKYAMINVPFGPARIWIIRDLISIPFMAVAFDSVLVFLGIATFKRTVSINPSRKIRIGVSLNQLLAIGLVGVSLSAFSLASIYQAYAYERALFPTQLEVEAVKFIDENTVGRYVVLTTNTWTTLIGHGFVGTNNPRRYYVYGAYSYPSISEIVEIMEEFQSTVAYFLVPSFRTADFESVVAEASKNYGLFKVFNNDKG
jgi:hypothetical protein